MDIQMTEEIVFDDVVNEVSICSAEEPSTKSPHSMNQSNATTTTTITLDSSTTPSKLTQPSVQYITTVKAPTPTKVGSIPSPAFKKNVHKLSKMTPVNEKLGKKITSPEFSGVQRTQTIKMNTSATTPTSASSAGITFQPNQMLTKLIMTSSGQQLMISSPMKNDGKGMSTVTPINFVPSGDQQQLMAIIPVSNSPVKTGNKNVVAQITTPTSSIRSKPVPIAPSPTVVSTPEVQKPQQIQMIRLVPAQNTGNTQTSMITTLTTSNSVSQVSNLKPITANVGGQQKILIPATALKGLNAGQLIATSSSGTTGAPQQIFMYTPQIIQPVNTIKTVSPTSVPQSPTVVNIAPSPVSQRTSFIPILPSPSSSHSNIANNEQRTPVLTGRIISNGISKSHTEDILSMTSAATVLPQAPVSRPRKPCNCTRSQCLKLYCDCFANGEFCSNCNCVNCSNNLDHEEERQKAIKQCLERNPHAFHPKIGKGKTTAQEGIERRHTKGCNCRRSGCLKNYCECYEAKILCSDLCKCCACKNYEDSYERKTLLHLADAAETRSSTLHTNTISNSVGTSLPFASKENEPLWNGDFRAKLPIISGTDRLLPCSFITNQVLNATCKCLIAQMDGAKKQRMDEEETERALLEEFGRCLMQVIKSAKKKENEQS